MQVDSRLVLYFRLNRKGTNVDNVFSSDPFSRNMWAPALVQRVVGTGGAIVTIAGNKYLPTVVTVVHARAHFDAVSGGTTLAQLQNQFKQKEGFTMRYDGTNETITLPWHLIISLAMELLVFGPPLDGTRNY